MSLFFDQQNKENLQGRENGKAIVSIELNFSIFEAL